VTLIHTIYLLRHAESAPDRSLPESNWPLSQQGKVQAEALVPVLKKLGIQRIVSSPYLRARCTVEPFAWKAGLEIAIDTDLRERTLAQGIEEDWMTLIRRAWADLSYSAPGGKSGLDCQRRFATCVDRWLVQCPGETLLICSHGNAIGLYLNLLDQAFGFGQWQAMRNPDLFRLVSQDSLVIWDRRFTFSIL